MLSFPPWFQVSSEICFGPRIEFYDVIRDFNMSKCQTEGSWSSNDFAGLVILRAVAWAHIFVGGSVPWNNAAQMGADGIDSIVSNTIFGRDEVMGITFETLNQLSVTWLMFRLPACEFDLVAVGIESSDTSSATTLGWWDEEVDKATAHPADWKCSSSQKDEVHNRSSLHVWDKFVSTSGSHCDFARSWILLTGNTSPSWMNLKIRIGCWHLYFATSRWRNCSNFWSSGSHGGTIEWLGLVRLEVWSEAAHWHLGSWCSWHKRSDWCWRNHTWDREWWWLGGHDILCHTHIWSSISCWLSGISNGCLSWIKFWHLAFRSLIDSSNCSWSTWISCRPLGLRSCYCLEEGLIDLWSEFLMHFLFLNN